MRIGYTLSSEQSGPVELARHAVLAEDAGFDFLAASDHFTPWLESQGHSPAVWPVLGAVAQATRDIPLMTMVTCPTMRYHPAVVAQQAATVQLLSRGRFRLGLGSGENLNEHVVGRGWPHVDQRQEMLVEATKVIRRLLSGETVNHHGRYFHVPAARVWDVPDVPVPVGIAVSGPKGCRIAGEHADFMVAVEPDPALVRSFVEHGGAGKPRVAQVVVCWDADRETAVRRAHRQAPWFLLGMGAITGLATPYEFRAAAGAVSAEEIAAAIPCGPDAVEPTVQAVRAFADLGYEEVALMQVGGDKEQQEFAAWARRELLPELRCGLGKAKPPFHEGKGG